MKRIVQLLFLTALVASFATVALKAAEPTFDAQLLDALPVRPIGPANMGGRITGVAVVESKPSIMYVASATGGLWKTTNNGTSWTAVFENEASVSLGDVAVAPSDPDIVWVGTGEANARNSVSSGDGVYKSIDGGKTWKNMGLRDSQHIGRIIIHPKDPDIVYVAALGHLWGANRERGIYKTADGGKTWRPVCYLNEDTGFVDLAMDPSDSDVLYGCAYQVRRDAFSGGNPAVQTGADAGIYKTDDAGKTWKKLTEGLPDRPIGRCGIAIARNNPRVVYAVVQTDQTKLLRATELGQESKPGDKAETGGIFRSTDKGKTWSKLNDLCPRPFYYGQIRVDPNDDKHVIVLGVSLHSSTDSGRNFHSSSPSGVHPDHHALWIDPNDSAHMVLANDGGLCFSHDQGKSWEHLKNLPIAQFYTVAVDMHSPYRVFGGLQDNGSWGGPSATHYKEGISTVDWFRISAADGFYCTVDPNDSDTVYCESQYAGFVKRLNLKTSAEREIQPITPRGKPAYRFNWCTPILLSSHNSQIIYLGGDHLFRSLNRGDNWEEISPDLTLGKPGPSDNTGHTISTIAESPVKSRTVFVGTDDGKVQVTKNGGDAWTDVSDKIPGVAAERYITRVECSHFDESTAYVTLSRHRNDDRKPYVFRTTDFGATWKALTNDLPADGPLNVIREDPENRDLLFVGTELGLFISLNGGANWLPIHKTFPTVPVYDLAIHPRDRDLVVGTHGRGVYIIDIKPLEELTTATVSEPLHVFDIKPATVFSYKQPRGLGASKLFTAPNPDYGAAIYYYLKDKSDEPVKVVIADALGKALVTLDGENKAGLHRIVWDLRSGKTEEGKPAPALVKPGDYVVRIEIGEKVVKKKVRVEAEK